jgi:hypothetical protein
VRLCHECGGAAGQRMKLCWKCYYEVLGRSRLGHSKKGSENHRAVSLDLWIDRAGREPYWTAERIIDSIDRWAGTHAEPPTADDWRVGMQDWKGPFGPYRPRGHPSATMVAHVFGSWSAGLTAAGFTPRPRGWSAEARAKGTEVKRRRAMLRTQKREAAQARRRQARTKEQWTRERIIASIQAWAHKHGGVPPTVLEWRPKQNGPGYRGGHPSTKTVADAFGSWSAAIDAAGFKARNRGGQPGATHCARGHEFTPENTYLHPRGVRMCRTCKRRKARA